MSDVVEVNVFFYKIYHVEAIRDALLEPFYRYFRLVPKGINTGTRVRGQACGPIVR
jgi:hypothetical protein